MALAPGCFSIDEPPCSYACGPNQACPDDYQCLSDGYCHRLGTSGSCDYPDGGTVDAAIDLAMPVDASSSDSGAD